MKRILVLDKDRLSFRLDFRRKMEGDVIIDTLINKVTLDTSGVILKTYALQDTARTDASLYNKWSDYITLKTTVVDSATFADSVLNQRIVNYYIELK